MDSGEALAGLEWGWGVVKLELALQMSSVRVGRWWMARLGKLQKVD